MKNPSKEQISRWLSMVFHDGGQLAFISSSGVQLEIEAYFNAPATTGPNDLNKPFINKMHQKLKQELLTAYLTIKESVQEIKDVSELEKKLAHAVDTHSKAIVRVLEEFGQKSSYSPNSTASTFDSEANKKNHEAAILDSKINIIEWAQESLSGNGVSPLSAASKGGVIGLGVGFALAIIFVLIFASPMAIAAVAGLIVASAIVGSIIGAVGTKLYYQSQAEGYIEDTSLHSDFEEKHTEAYNAVFSPPHSVENTPPRPKEPSSPYSSVSSTLGASTTSSEQNGPKNTQK